MMPPSHFINAYGGTLPAAYGMIMIYGYSRPNNFQGDTYYFMIDSSHQIYNGYQVNGATTITWERKLGIGDFTISGIDLTNFSKLYISTTHEDYNNYGEAYCNVGIDNANTRFFTVNGCDGIVTRTITLDVSSYSGVHTLKFHLYARSDSSYSGYHTNCQIGITEIKLYN